MREPALAMMMGALPQGNNFGFGYGFGHPGMYPSGYSSASGYGYGHPGMGYGYGATLPTPGAMTPAQQASYDAYMNSASTQAQMASQAAQAAANAAAANVAKAITAQLGPAVSWTPEVQAKVQAIQNMAAQSAGTQTHAIVTAQQAAQPPVHPSDPRHPQHAAHAAHQWELANPSSSTSRSLLLDPNRDSAVKVERYSFSFSPAANLVLGAASNIATFTQQPSTSIKGQRVIMNAPVPGFVLISSLQIANINVLVGGTEDAFTYSAGAQGVMLDLPRLDPQNRATSAGAYTGVLPPGYTQGNSFQFIITLQGPSSLAGGYGQ